MSPGTNLDSLDDNPRWVETAQNKVSVSRQSTNEYWMLTRLVNDFLCLDKKSVSYSEIGCSTTYIEP